MPVETKWTAAGSRPGAAHYLSTSLLLLAIIMMPQLARGQDPAADRVQTQRSIPLTDWDDDWWYPEGPIKIMGLRYALFGGAIVTSFADASSRDRFGSRLIDPNVTLYRPGHKGPSFDVDVVWSGLTKRGEKARYLAPTVGLRHSFVESTRARRLVPFAAVRTGPYFAKTSASGSRTVIGANGTLGLEVARRFSVALRYDLVRQVDRVNLSTVAVDVAVGLPFGRPRGAAAKMKDVVPPPGRMIDVGGHRLHLVCLGEGTPTVVLDSGLSDAWIAWSKVQPALAGTTRVCAYDRAGIGYSDPGPLPRTSEQIVNELHLLLQRAGIAAPYLLVGHSFGGLNIRLFAARFPGEVTGMVLVDASHEEQLSRYPSALQRQRQTALAQLRQRVERAEAGTVAQPIVANLPVAVASRPAWLRTLYEEFRALPDSVEQVRALDRTLDMPLVVVTAGRQDGSGMSRREQAAWRQTWSELQADLVRLSPQGRQVIATKSTHYVQREAPQVVIEAVRSILEQQRTRPD